jgi:hypothetical protein
MFVYPSPQVRASSVQVGAGTVPLRLLELLNFLQLPEFIGLLEFWQPIDFAQRLEPLERLTAER